MGDMQIGQRIQPAPQLKNVSAPIQMPKNIVIEKKTSDEMQQIQQKSNQSKELGIVGTRAQIDDLKARVNNMDMQGVEPAPEIGTLETLAKYGGTALSVTGSVLAAPFKMVKSHLTSGFVEAAENRELGSHFSKSGDAQINRAQEMRGSAEQLGDLRTQLTELLAADEPDWTKVDTALKEVGTHLDSAGFSSASVDTARSQLWNDPSSVREVLNTISAVQPIIRTMADSVQSKGETLKEKGGDLTSEGTRTALQNTMTVVQTAAPVINTINFISQGVQAAQNSQSFAATLAEGGGKLLNGAALTGVVVGAGALQIVGEGIDMYKNATRLNSALNRVEMARGMLADAPARAKMAAKFEAQAKELEAPQTKMGKISLFFSRKSSRLEKASELKAKAAAIRALPVGAPSKEARIVAEQIIKRADTGFKMLKIAKNVLGIVAGAVAIAVAVGAMATPVGWAIAGTALAATVGCAIYCKVKSSQRQGKIDDIKGVQTQTALKIETKQNQIGQMNGQVQEISAHISQQIQEQNRLLQPLSDSDQVRFNSLDASITASKETLKTLKSSLEGLEQDVTSLKEMQKEAVIQLLGASPEEAAKVIYAGAKAGNREMIYLAENVLNVPSCQVMPEKDAVQLLMRGMSLNPNL
jgi:hypothetical protein